MNNRVKTFGRTAAAVTAATAPVAGLTLAASPALAHGTMQNPISRSLACYQENPESPRSAACKAAVAAGGPQPFYDWNGVRSANAAGRHRQVVPNGKLCSAGDPAFRGLDLARADWPATNLKSGAAYTFRFRVTAQHRGGFQLYITKNGYDPRKPLTWANLESKPFLTKNDPVASGGVYTLPGKLPAGKKGRHLIYMIWQRTDSPEAFYSCSDVVFGGTGGSAGGGAGKPSTKPTAKPKPAPTQPGRPCAPIAPPHTHHDDQVALKSRPASNDSPASGDAAGTAMIAGTVGLALGGVGGLLLTGRRRRDAARPRG